MRSTRNSSSRRSSSATRRRRPARCRATTSSSTPPTCRNYAFDVAKANALLDEAGYTRGADGTRFALKLLPAPYFNETKQFGDYLRQALAEIGIDAELVNNDAAAHQKAVYTDHAFDLAVAPPVFRGDPAISTTILVQSGIPDGVPFSNQGGYANAELDELIAKAAETLDAERASRSTTSSRRRWRKTCR